MDKYIKLSNSVKMPILGFGTWQLKEGEEAYSSVLSALNNGYDHIDTAMMYQNEKSVGKAIKDSNRNREELFITTKINNDVFSYEDTINAVKRSLDYLQVDYIDLVIIHWPNPLAYRDKWQERNANVYRALEDLYEEKIIKAIGTSNFSLHHFNSLFKTLKVIPHVNQMFVSPGTVNKEIIDFCKEKDISITSYSPLGRGHVLSNETIIKIGEKYNKTPAQVSIRWCLDQGFSTLTRSTKEERIIENMQVFDFSLLDAEIEAISNIEGSLDYPDPDSKEY